MAMEINAYLMKDLKGDVLAVDLMGTLDLVDLCKKTASVSRLADVKENTAPVERSLRRSDAAESTISS